MVFYTRKTKSRVAIFIFNKKSHSKRRVAFYYYNFIGYGATNVPFLKYKVSLFEPL